MAICAQLEHHEKMIFHHFHYVLRGFKWVPLGDILENWG